MIAGEQSRPLENQTFRIQPSLDIRTRQRLQNRFVIEPGIRFQLSYGLGQPLLIRAGKFGSTHAHILHQALVGISVFGEGIALRRGRTRPKNKCGRAKELRKSRRCPTGNRP